MDGTAKAANNPLADEIRSLERELAATRRLLDEATGRGTDSDRYHALFSASREGQLLVNDEGRYVEVNEAYAKLLKTTTANVIGRHFSEFMPPDRLAEAEAAFVSMMSGGAALREFPLLAVDGTVVDCEWTVRPHFLPGLSLCSARNIAERKRAEENLRASEARFRAAVSAVSSLVWTSNAQGEMESAQPAWSNFTGQGREQYRGYGWADAVHPEDAQATIVEWKRAVAGRRMFAFEHRVRRKDGVYRRFSIRAVPVLDQSGALREWVGVHTDITEERQLMGALRESEERLRLAQSAVGIGIWDWDLATGTVNWSPEIYRLLGLEPGKVDPSMNAWTRHIHPDDLDRVLAEVHGSLVSGNSVEVEFRVVRGDGEVRWLLSRARVFRDEEGKAVRVLGLTMDVTVSKRMERRTAFLVSLDDATRPLADPNAIIQTAAARLGEYLDVQRCIYAEVDPDENGFQVIGDFRRGVRGMAGRYDFAEFGPDCARLLRQGRAYAVEDAEAEAGVPMIAEGYRTHSIRAAIWVPLRKGERLVGAMAVHQNAPRHWQPDELELVTQVANRCWESMERARAEAEVRRQSRTFDAVLSNIPDLMCTFDLSGRITYANAALLDLWGKQLSEVIGLNTFELGYPPSLAERIQQEVQTVIETDRPVRNHTPFAGADGASRSYEYIFSPVRSHAGIVEAVTCTARDITSRERMERELAESRQRLQQVFAQAPLAIVVLRGADLVVEMANTCFRGLLQGRELLGRPLAEAAPELGGHVWQALGGVMRTGEPFVASEWYIPYDQNGDGKVEDHWFHVACEPLREADGQVSGLVGLGTEVSGQVLARRELERANRELEEFAFVASHDLQEPLRMVGIYSQLLVARYLQEDADAAEYLGFVREGVKRMERLIQDLLSYSRVVHADGPATAGANLDEALAQALKTMQGRIRDEGAVVTVSSLPVVRGDTQQMALVFQNLLSNSVKYRRPEAALQIAIGAEKFGDGWIVTVRDNGIGFQQQYAERIFGLFKRLHKDEYSGTGLGLAICQRIVERYGGRIWAEGDDGKGATFYFALPEPETSGT